MKVLSFRAIAIDHYRRAQRTHSLVKKKIRDGQWVRGHVARIDQLPGSIHIVYLTVEEFDGGLEAERLPPGFRYGRLPTITIGDPSNQQMEFTFHEDHASLYLIGQLVCNDRVEGMIVKTRRAVSNKPYWIATVEYPGSSLGRVGDIEFISISHRDSGRTDGRGFVIPEVESIVFRVPQNNDELGTFMSKIRNNERLSVEIPNQKGPSGRQLVTGFVSNITCGPIDLMGRESYCEVTLVVPPTTRGRSPLTDAYASLKDCDGYMERVLGLKRSGEMTFPINWLEETTMKIYDAVVVKVDDKGVPTEVVKVVAPFLAKDDAAAKTAVTVDYAAENKIAGKDLTGISVLVRTFQGGSY